MEKMSLMILAVLCHVFHVECDIKVFSSKENKSNPIVETTVGTIQGRRSEDGTYFMFKGIPYAKVNESNIFGPAIPHPRFEDIFDANIEAACPQKEEFKHTIIGSLDCLHVNVYVPNKADTKDKLPVFVWLYGGKLEIGFAGTYLYGPSFIVRHDVILVTFNYRLGLYGFFCLDIPEVAGNQGLKDQVLALRWVKNNINAFGGDENRITLGGNSVGASCINLHLHYLKEKLFHRIIPQSIIPPLNDFFGESDLNLPIRLAENLNYSTTDIKDALAFLSQVEAKTVIAASLKLRIECKPCIEKKFVNADNYITEHPMNVRLPNLKEIDVLTGITDDEIGLVCSSFFLNKLKGIQFAPALLPWKTTIQNQFEFGDNTQVLNEMANIVKQFYLGDEDLSFENCQRIANMASDFVINYQTLKIVQTYMENGVKNIYFYLFSYNGERNFGSRALNFTKGRAIHSDELGYLFDISYMNKPMDPTDELIVDRMTELWTKFIKYGNPTPAPTKLVPMIWPRVTLNKMYFLQLDSELRVIPNPFHDRMAFVELFYKSNWIYYKHLKQNITYIQHLSKNKNVTDGTNILHLNFVLLCVVSIFVSVHFFTFNKYF